MAGIRGSVKTASNMRIIYMGAGDIGLPSLRWLIEECGHDIVGVFTQPDKPVGRKQVLTPPAVKTLAEAAGVPVFQPEKLRGNAEALVSLSDLEPDLAVVMAYGQILPQAVIDAPKIACINLHASLLPRHRGASPIQAAIREGDAETGITVMHIVKALDAGDMITKAAIPIDIDDTGGSLHDKLAELGPGTLAEGLPLFEAGSAPREAQDDTLVTYAPKLLREDGEIDWSKPATEIERLIRAYDPWPGTYSWLETEKGRQKLKLYPTTAADSDSTGSDQPSNPVGSIASAGGERIEVSCGENTRLILAENGALQLEGRKRLSVPDFLHGHPIEPGTKLG